MDAETKRILDQARAYSAERSELKAELRTRQRFDDASSHFDPVRRSWPDGRPPPEPPLEKQKLDTVPTDWPAIEQYVERRLEEERSYMLSIVAETVEAIDLLVTDREKAIDERNDTTALTQQIAGLKSVCDELRIALGERSKSSSTDVVELPPWPRRTGHDVN